MRSRQAGAFAVVLVCALVAMTPGAATASTASAAAKRCGTFDTDALRYTVSRSGDVRCTTAMRIVKSFIRSHDAWRKVSVDGTVAGTYYTHRRFPRWRCFEGSGGGSCTRGRRTASYENEVI